MKVQEKVLHSADQAEMAALIRMAASPISIGLHDERVEGSLDDIDDVAPARGRALDDLQGKVTEEIDRRIALLGEHYPFVRLGNALEYRGSPHHLYEFLLATAVVGEYSSGRFRVLPRVFEVAACFAAQAYLGADACAYRTGWPRAPGEPKRLKAVIQRVRQLTGNLRGEWAWGPKEGKPDDPLPRDTKDQGLDVVAWKASPDGRTGQLYLLGQCACGSNWGTDAKLLDLNIDKLNQWLREMCLVAPVKSIFTPHHADDDQVLDASRLMKGLVFDRARMVLLAQRAPVNEHMAAHSGTLQKLTKMCASLVPV